jgi:hypothetical protein
VVVKVRTGAGFEGDGGRKPVTDSVVWLTKVGGDGLEDKLEDVLDVVGDGLRLVEVGIVPAVVVIPSTLAATAMSAHPTYTPRVVFMGNAKHC